MIAVTEQVNSDVTDLAQQAREMAATGPDWLRPVRAKAAARFAALGLPTTKHEDWRFTNLEPISATPFTAADGSTASPVTADDLARFAFPGLDCCTLVFVNGRFTPALSNVCHLPAGASVVPLAEAFSSHDELLRRHLGHYARFDDNAFTALNTAFGGDGMLIHVPRDTVVDEPIHVLNIAADPAGESAAVMTHPRNLIVADQGAQVAVLEHYAALTRGVYLTNAVTEIAAGDNAVVHHYFVEDESTAAFNVSTLEIHQGRDSRVDSHSVLLGGALVRNNVHPVMAGQGGNCLINGLYVGSGTQHLDNFMRVEHTQPHCDSRQFYKGILDDRAHGVFSGRIVVHPDAQKTDAKQTNANLLLSDGAQIDTMPQLEIFADDVKCTHGATVGQIDPEAVFYLRSRGIEHEAAHAMLIYAFANESLHRMHCQPVRNTLAKALLKRMRQRELLEAIL